MSTWGHTNVGARRGGEKWGVCMSVCVCVQGGCVCNGNGVHECECEDVCADVSAGEKGPQCVGTTVMYTVCVSAQL